MIIIQYTMIGVRGYTFIIYYLYIMHIIQEVRMEIL